MGAPLESDDGLTPEQEQAVIALVNEPNIQKAADAAKVTPRTIYNWLATSAFSAAYRKARRETFSHAIAMAQRYAPMAVNVLAKVMSDANAPHHARVTAAVSLLKFSRESIELDDLTGRIEALEIGAKQGEKDGDGSRWRSRAA